MEKNPSGEISFILKIAILTLAILLCASAVNAQDKAIKTDDILFEADKIIHNKKDGYIETTGNAKFAWRDYLLSADRVRYYESKNLIEAAGHAILVEPDGAIIFAQKMRITENWQNSKISNLAIVFSDDSRMTARSADRKMSDRFGQRNEMQSVTYSPCAICQGKPNHPVWQITAGRVVHHERSKTLYYNNIFFELFGVPVLYLPILSHPDPGVKHKTGLLIPAISNSSIRGTEISLPFYINISPQIGAEVTPTITQKQGAVLRFDWDHVLTNGLYHISASAARSYDKRPENWPNERNTRGHFFSDGQFRLGQNSRWEYGIQLASDDTYLRFFDIAGNNNLISHVSAEWRQGAHGLSIANYSFDSLLDEPTTFILPFIEYDGRLEEKLFGGVLDFKTSLLSLLRESEQEDVIRFSLSSSWQNDLIGPLGSVFLFYGRVRYDAYSRHCNTFSDSLCDQKKQTLTRVLPLAMLDWRWPFFHQSEDVYQVFEPIVQLIYAPYRSGSDPVPNEDSLSFDFSDSNVLTADRFSGLDQSEDGPRMNAGLQWSLYQHDDYAASFLFGQVFRLKDNQAFSEESGLHDKKSDLVARLALSFRESAVLTQSARLDRKNFALRRYEADISASYGPFGFFSGYAQTNTVENADKAKEIHAGLAMRFGQYWRVYGSIRRNLEENRSVRNSFGFLYDDECLKLDFSFQQKFTVQNPDIERDLVIGVRISLKNIGNVKLSTGASFPGSTDFKN